MKWEKLGRVYDPEAHADAFAQPMSHGANPAAMRLRGDVYRFFYNVRDAQNRSCVTFLDYDMGTKRVLQIPGKILIAPGERGAFDDSGCSLGSVLDLGDKCYLYYLGWNLPRALPFLNLIGMAVYDKQTDACRKISAGPILGRADPDPFSLSYPFVLKRGDRFQMWYGSHISWGNTTPEANEFIHVIKYATSEDGICFDRTGTVCIGGDGVKEYAFARPSVLLGDGLYHMWYTYRGEKYRIGYAVSQDGIAWDRRDREVGIEPAADGWEGGEICYPSVFRHGNDVYMLYCGARYGKTGFGLAKLAEGAL